MLVSLTDVEWIGNGTAEALGFEFRGVTEEEENENDDEEDEDAEKSEVESEGVGDSDGGGDGEEEDDEEEGKEEKEEDIAVVADDVADDVFASGLEGQSASSARTAAGRSYQLVFEAAPAVHDNDDDDTGDDDDDEAVGILPLEEFSLFTLLLVL